jgi:redox-sensing transcriptional repressor
MRKIAESTVRRLSLYLRFLEEFEEQGVDTVSSEALATRGGTTSAQVRKDLSFFGSFGKRGLGYSVPELAFQLRDILGLGRTYRLTVIGAGNIGVALVHFRGFEKHGFRVVSLYDADPKKIGRKRSNLIVRDQMSIEEDILQEPIDMAILVTPASAAQELVDRLVQVGVMAFLNFAPVQLRVPDGVVVKNVSLALELEALSYGLRNR